MSNRLAGLDGLRGIAALSVLAFHCAGAIGNAFLAVDFFFMLSGYVMARTYEARLNRGYSAVQFLKARFRRLWPTMFVAGLIGTPVFVAKFGLDAWPFVIANLLMIPAFAVGRIYPLNGPAWSILLELFANLLHGLFLRRLSLRLLSMFSAGAFACLALAAWQTGSMDLGSSPATLVLGIPRVAFDYSIGIIAFRQCKDEPPIQVPPLITLGAMPLFFIVSSLSGSHFWASDLLFVGAVCPLLLVGGLQTPRFEHVADRLGAISFPLYAVHMPILWTAEWLNFGPLAAASVSLILASAMVWAQESAGKARGSLCSVAVPFNPAIAASSVQL